LTGEVMPYDFPRTPLARRKHALRDS
jgi:hypothetical protein